MIAATIAIIAIATITLLALAFASGRLQHVIKGQKHMTIALQDLQAASAAQRDLLVTQGALLNRAITKLDDLAAKVAALPADDAAIAALAAEITASNDAIRAENTAVATELDKLDPPAPTPSPTTPAG